MISRDFLSFTWALHVPRYKVYGVQEYQVPAASTWQDFVDHIGSLPLSSPPQVFGLHENADLAKDHRETEQVRN